MFEFLTELAVVPDLDGKVVFWIQGPKDHRNRIPARLEFVLSTDREDAFLGNAVLKIGRIALGKTINQLVLVWPAWWTRSLDSTDTGEECRVRVPDVAENTETFQLNYLQLFGIPLSE